MTETKLNLDSLMVMFDICECKNCVSIKKELWIVKRCRNIESWSDDKEMYIMDNNSVTLSGKTCDTAKCQQGHTVLITWHKENVSKKCLTRIYFSQSRANFVHMYSVSQLQ